MDHPAADQAADLVLGDVLAGEDMDVVAALQLGGVDALDVGMRVRRAHEHGVGLARAIDVVGVLALAGDEALVFLAPYWRSDAGCGSWGFLPWVFVVCRWLVAGLSCRRVIAAAERLFGGLAAAHAGHVAAPARTAATMLW